MCGSKIENTKLITIAGTVADNKISVTINDVFFIPDVMIVRSIAYNPDQADTVGFYNLKFDLVDSNVIGFVGVDYHYQADDTEINKAYPVQTPNTSFPLNKQVRGTYTLRTEDLTATTPADIAGGLAIQVEFIKYQK